MPPVKLACLACRATRVRCDGERPCNTCLRKERECSYLPSRRGGARNRHTPKLNGHLDESVISQADEYINQINEFLSPGAGLRQLVIPQPLERQYGDHDTTAVSQDSSIQSPSAIRAYIEEKSLLNAYYIFIHPFFPVLPPPCVPIRRDDPIHWSAETDHGVLAGSFSSPLSLAISATLALIPLGEEECYNRDVDINARSRIAHRFARQALEQVEVDTEHENFAFASQYTDTIAGQNCIGRNPLHPGLPIELESIVSLLILSNYEQAQRGNLLKMAARSCQASALAKGLSLHCQSSLVDDFSEARRRTWWMTYATAYLASLSCHKSFVGIVDECEITTPYPQVGFDAQCWAILVETLRISMASLQFAVTQKAVVLSGQGMTNIQQQIHDIRNSIEKATMRLESSVPPFTTIDSNLTTWEANSAQIMRRLCHIKLASATIQIHRYQAFSDIPVFIKDYCRIPSASPAEEIDKLYMSPQSQGTNNEVHLARLSQPQSASLCVDAALTIARQLQQLTMLRSPEGDKILPSLMPISTCCAMQATYSIVMQLSSIRISQVSQAHLQQVAISERLLDELFHGLERIVQIFERHARIYVAMGGIKDQVQAICQLEFQPGRRLG